MQDIQNIEDIKLMVDTFYKKVLEDDLIGPIFNEKLNGRWPEHLAKMHRFWGTILLNEQSYQGSPFAPHARMPLEKEHFERWLSIFRSSMDELFAGDKAEEAKMRAEKMAQMFNYKIDYIREHNM